MKIITITAFALVILLGLIGSAKIILQDLLFDRAGVPWFKSLPRNDENR